MGRIMAIDFGQKRSGLAVTDPLQLIANGLETVASASLIDYIKNYTSHETVDCIVVGDPRDMSNMASDASRFTEPFVARLKKAFPDIPVERYDERFTSKMAFQSMIDAGLSRKRRQDKALVDTISATILLQSFLEAQKSKLQNS
jgi:putative Holliday junction resolvase